MSTLKKNFGFSLLLNISNIIFPIVTFPYATRILGPEGIGKVQFASTFVQYFMLIAALGIPVYGIREVAKHKHDIVKLKRLFSELVILNFITSAVFAVVYVLIVFYTPSLNSDFSFYLVAILMLLLSFCNVDWLFSGLEKFRFIAMRSVFVKGLAIIVLYLIVKEKSDDINYLWILVGITVFNNVWNIWAARGYFDYKLILTANLRKHVRPLIFIFSTVAAISVYALLDTIILGFIKGYEAVGYYTAGTKINKITIPILTSLGTVLMPRIAHAFKANNISEVKSLTKYSLEVVIILGVPMCIGLIAMAPELILLFSGKDFLPAILPMQIYAPVILIIGFSNVFAIQILTPAGKDKQVTFSVLIGLVTSFCLNFLLIPLYSYTGAAITNLIAESLVMIAFIYFTSQVIRINFNIRLLLYTFLVSLCVFPIIISLRWAFNDQTFIICFLTVFIWGLLYAWFHIYLLKNPMVLEQLSMMKKKMGLVPDLID